MAMLRAVVGAVAWLSGPVRTGRNTGQQRWLCSVVRHRVTMCQSPAGTGKGQALGVPGLCSCSACRPTAGADPCHSLAWPASPVQSRPYWLLLLRRIINKAPGEGRGSRSWRGIAWPPSQNLKFSIFTNFGIGTLPGAQSLSQLGCRYAKGDRSRCWGGAPSLVMEDKSP